MQILTIAVILWVSENLHAYIHFRNIFHKLEFRDIVCCRSKRNSILDVEYNKILEGFSESGSPFESEAVIEKIKLNDFKPTYTQLEYWVESWLNSKITDRDMVISEIEGIIYQIVDEFSYRPTKYIMTRVIDYMISYDNTEGVSSAHNLVKHISSVGIYEIDYFNKLFQAWSKSQYIPDIATKLIELSQIIQALQVDIPFETHQLIINSWFSVSRLVETSQQKYLCAAKIYEALMSMQADGFIPTIHDFRIICHCICSNINIISLSRS